MRNGNRFTLFSTGEVHPFWEDLRNQGCCSNGMLAIYDTAGINLVILLDPCSGRDVRLIRNGGLKFGLGRMNGGYCWLLRTEVATLDAPFNPCLLPPELRNLPWSGKLMPKSRACITLHLIDGAGVARLLKCVTVSPYFTSKLEAVHAEALAAGVSSVAQWNAEVAGFNRRYPIPEAAFDDAVVVSRGGD